MASAPVLGERLRTAEPRSEGRVVLDMSEVDFIDSSGIAELLRFKQSGHTVEIRAAAPCVWNALTLAGVADLFTPRASRLDAEAEPQRDDRLRAAQTWSALQWAVAFR
jgi:anti-anti-sigma regulatory factor